MIIKKYFRPFNRFKASLSIACRHHQDVLPSFQIHSVQLTMSLFHSPQTYFFFSHFLPLIKGIIYIPILLISTTLLVPPLPLPSLWPQLSLSCNLSHRPRPPPHPPLSWFLRHCSSVQVGEIYRACQMHLIGSCQSSYSVFQYFLYKEYLFVIQNPKCIQNEKYACPQLLSSLPEANIFSFFLLKITIVETITCAPFFPIDPFWPVSALHPGIICQHLCLSPDICLSLCM